MTTETGVKVFVGPANQLEIGTVTSAEAPAATLTTVSPTLQRLDLVLQKGDKGDDVGLAQINAPTVRFDQFPIALTDTVPINSSIVYRTVGEVIYAAFWDSNMNPHVAKMKDGDSVWQTFNLGTLPGNPLVAPAPADEHNNLAIIVDGAGYIHVSGNMHRVPLNYVRSTAPGVITGWEAPGMVGTNELEVTYPVFVRLNDGNLLFFYRDGTSSDGDLVLNKYDTGTRTWTRVGMILKGHDWLTAADDVSAYPSRIVYDSTPNRMHMWWVWRDTIDISSNFDLCYMYSVDGGVTWKNAAGATVTLPVTPAETSVKVFAGGSGHVLTGACFDTSGNAHAAVRMADGEVRHYKRVGSSITYESLGTGMGKTDLVPTPDGRIYAIYNLTDAAYIKQVTPTIEAPIKLYPQALGNWTPRAVTLTGSYTTRLIIAPVNGTAAGNIGGVLTVSLTTANLAAMAAGATMLPRPRPPVALPDPVRHAAGSYGMVSGMCYGPAGPRGVNASLPNGTFRGTLITAARAGKIVEATINVTTVGPAGSKVRIVAYRTDGKLVAQSADIDVSATTGAKTVAFVCNIGKNEQYILGTLHHSSTGAGGALLTAITGHHDARIPFSSASTYFSGIKSGWSLTGIPVPAVDTTPFLDAAQASNDNIPAVTIKCGAMPGDWSTPE